LAGRMCACKLPKWSLIFLCFAMPRLSGVNTGPSRGARDSTSRLTQQIRHRCYNRRRGTFDWQRRRRGRRGSDPAFRVGTLMTMASASRLMWIQSTLLLACSGENGRARRKIATAMALEPPMPAPAGATNPVVSGEAALRLGKNLGDFREEGEAVALLSRARRKRQKLSSSLMSRETSFGRFPPAGDASRCARKR